MALEDPQTVLSSTPTFVLLVACFAFSLAFTAVALSMTTAFNNNVHLNNNSNMKKTFVVSPILEANWYEALRTCAYNQMQLATISNQNESDELQNVMKAHGVSRLWIGATDLAKRGGFYWSGTGVGLDKYSNWYDGEPNNLEGRTERCVYARDDGRWNNVECDEKRHFACEKYESTKDPASCTSITKKVFLIPDIKADWHEAERLCSSFNTHLATIRNQQENDELRVLMEKNRQQKCRDISWIWIGANDLAEVRRFAWGVDGAPLNYTNWEKGQPDHWLVGYPDSECVKMNSQGEWYDFRCNDPGHFACEVWS